jgi:hypothetical protein
MPGASKKGHKGFYRKAEKSRGDSKYEPKECVIGIDQSYTRTGISIAVNGKLKKVTSVDFKGTTTKTAKRLLLQEKLRSAIQACLRNYSPVEVAIICERLRTFTAGDDLRPNVIKPGAAMIAYIVDTGAEFGIDTWSVDTRAWKSAVLGSSKPIFEPIKGVKNPQKFGSVRKVIDLGFEESIMKCRGNGAFFAYDDDAADSACIALYGFVSRPALMKEQ